MMKEIALLLYDLTNVNAHLFAIDETLIFSSEESDLSQKLIKERIGILERLKNDINSVPDKKVLNFQNYNFQNFLLFFSGKDFLMYGPFLTSPPDTIMLETIQTYYRNSRISIPEIIHYYRSLQIMEVKKLSAVSRIILSLHSGKIIKGESLMDVTLPKDNISLPEILLRSTENQREVSLITERYNMESRFMHAISRGDKKSAFEILREFGIYMSVSDRVKGNPLRSILDLSITFNTILRIAASQGGVHPRQLHYLSEKFAILIETKKTLNETNHLRKQMIEEYCDAVKESGTHNYSSRIKKTIRYIQSNLDEDLSLASVSSEMSVNSSYLSRLFKHETGETFSSYVNKQRINHAAYLLSYTSFPIAEIAAQSGYNDTAYFCRIFRKTKSTSPSGFREMGLSS